MAKKVSEVDNVRVKLPVKLHKRVKHDALDYDLTVSDLVVCVLNAYAGMASKERQQMIRACVDSGVLPDTDVQGEQ